MNPLRRALREIDAGDPFGDAISEHNRNLLDRAVSLVETIAANDPNEPISDAGHTVLDGVRHEAILLVDDSLQGASKRALHAMRPHPLERECRVECTKLRRERDEAVAERIIVIAEREEHITELMAAVQDGEAALAGAREEADKLWRALFWIDNFDPELTEIVNGKFDLDMEGHLRALPSPTSEKAEGAEEERVEDA